MSGLAENPGLVVFTAVFIFFAAAAGAMVILWIALPFSVFGAKGLLTRIIEEQQKTNALLKELLEARRTSAVKEEAPEKRADRAEGDKIIDA